MDHVNHSFDNPWIDLALQQMWLYRQSVEVAAKCLDAELLASPQAFTDHCLNPTERRLNPIEFHGRRRPAATKRPSSAEPPRPHAAGGSRP